MIKYLFSLSFLLAIGFMFTACEEEVAITESVDNFVNNSVYAMHERAGVGKKGCFEFVYPISITFPDGSVAEIDSLRDLKMTIRAWKEDNPDATGRPELNFPLDIVTQDGEVITVDDSDELKELKRECKGRFGGPHGPNLRDCFDLAFPVTILFPDGTTAEVGDPMTLKQTLRHWKHDNPGATERPTLEFPLEVVQDGDTLTVNSKEELHALKEECRGE